jgi:hypothetical protein
MILIQLYSERVEVHRCIIFRRHLVPKKSFLMMILMNVFFLLEIIPNPFLPMKPLLPIIIDSGIPGPILTII